MTCRIALPQHQKDDAQQKRERRDTEKNAQWKTDSMCVNSITHMRKPKRESFNQNQKENKLLFHFRKVWKLAR